MFMWSFLAKMRPKDNAESSESRHMEPEMRPWMDAYIKFMEGAGFQRGAASPCAFWNARREVRGMVHGDDFTMLGDTPINSIGSRGKLKRSSSANIEEELDPLNQNSYMDGRWDTLWRRSAACGDSDEGTRVKRRIKRRRSTPCEG